MQKPAGHTIPVIGFLSSSGPRHPGASCRCVPAGLKDLGCIEGQNLAVEYRWAEGGCEQLPMLAADLVGHEVAVLVTTG